MLRTATKTGASNAVDEPRRREILALLAGGERPVGDLVRLLGMSWPVLIEHLRILREVGTVGEWGGKVPAVYALRPGTQAAIHVWVRG